MKLSKVLISLAVAFAFLATACTGAITPAPAKTEHEKELTKARLQLQWVAQAQFAGYFAAVNKGYYKEEGLDVEIKPGGPDINPSQVVAAGEAEFGIRPFVNVLQAREAGTDLVAVATVNQIIPGMLVSFKKSGIESVPDLKGKTVGSWLGGNESAVFATLRKYGLEPEEDVTIVKQGFDMSQLLNGDVDAAQANVYNEYAQLLETVNPETGKLYQPEDFNAISFHKEGITMLQDTLMTRESFLEQPGNEDLTVRFLKASFKGWIYCRNNMEDCVDIVLEAGSALGRSHQTWMLNEFNDLLWPAPNGIGVPNDPDAINKTIELALQYDLIKEKPSSDAWRLDFAKQAVKELREANWDVVGADFEKQTVELKPGGE